MRALLSSALYDNGKCGEQQTKQTTTLFILTNALCAVKSIFVLTVSNREQENERATCECVPEIFTKTTMPDLT